MKKWSYNRWAANFEGRRRIYTVDQLIRKMNQVCFENGLDPRTTPIGLDNNIIGGIEICKVYAGGDSIAESVHISTKPMRRE